MPIEGNPANTGSEANGTSAERQFDALLRLTNLVNRADAGVLSSFALTLDDADQRTQIVREDGKIYTYGYDAIGQLTNASATLPDGTPWSGYQFSYSYDATGNPIEQNKNGLVYSNSFNNLNQNVDSIPGGSLTVLGAVNYSGGTATVNNVQAQMAPDGVGTGTERTGRCPESPERNGGALAREAAGGGGRGAFYLACLLGAESPESQT